MSKLIMNIANLCYTVNKLYYEEEEEEKKKEYKKRFDELIKILEKAIVSDFDKNDKEYKKTLKKVKHINKEIIKLKKNLDKTERIFSYLSEIIENIDTLLVDTKILK